MFPFEQGQCSFTHIINIEAEFTHHDWSRSGSAKAIHPNDIAALMLPM